MGFFANPKIALDVAIFPLVTNLAILLFICFSIDLYISYQSPRVIIGVVAILWWYIGGLAHFVAYGNSTKEWDELLGGPTNFLIVIIIIITYPVFYLFWLPYVLFHLIRAVGSPWEVWQKLFDNSPLTLDKLIPDLVETRCELFINHLYVGIPFYLFCIIYIGFVIFLLPLWYFIFSPLGYGVLGVALNVSFHFPSVTSYEIEDRIERTYGMGTFIHVYVVCLPMFILSAVHVGVVGATWYNILLLVITIVNFAVDCYTAIRDAFFDIPIVGI